MVIRAWGLKAQHKAARIIAVWKNKHICRSHRITQQNRVLFRLISRIKWTDIHHCKREDVCRRTGCESAADERTYGIAHTAGTTAHIMMQRSPGHIQGLTPSREQSTAVKHSFIWDFSQLKKWWNPKWGFQQAEIVYWFPSIRGSWLILPCVAQIGLQGGGNTQEQKPGGKDGYHESFPHSPNTGCFLVRSRAGVESVADAREVCRG